MASLNHLVQWMNVAGMIQLWCPPPPAPPPLPTSHSLSVRVAGGTHVTLHVERDSNGTLTSDTAAAAAANSGFETAVWFRNGCVVSKRLCGFETAAWFRNDLEYTQNTRVVKTTCSHFFRYMQTWNHRSDSEISDRGDPTVQCAPSEPRCLLSSRHGTNRRHSTSATATRFSRTIPTPMIMF